MGTEDKQLIAWEMAVRNAATDEDRIVALNALAREQWAHGLTVSLETAQRAHQLACDIGSTHGLMQSLCTEGFLCFRQSNSAAAQPLLTQALALIQDNPDPAREAECRHTLGRVHSSLSELEAAMAQFLQARPLYEATADRMGLAQILNDIGALYFRMEDFAHALTYFRESLAQRRANADWQGVAGSLNNIACIYDKMDDLEQAIRSYQECLEAARATQYVDLEIRCLSNIAMVYASLSRWEEAFHSCQTALTQARACGNRDHEYLALASWGESHQIAKQHACAIPIYQQAQEIARELANQENECQIQTALGECFLAVKQLPEACAALTYAVENAELLEMKPLLYRACLGLSAVSEQEGDFGSALRFHQKFHAVHQEVLRVRAEDQTKTLLIQMQVEQVRKDAEIHKLRNVELAQANDALADANRTLQNQAEQMEAQAEELQAQAQELARQAAEDGLTGLANRRYLENWLGLNFYQARQDARPLTVALADVDHFKQVNDRFGHQIGDEVLMTVALLFRQHCRASDLAARYGGEEFVLALPDTDAAQALVLCERLRAAVQAHDWRTIHPALSVTLSMGLSDDLDADSHERLLGLADEQLYAAKHAGRNRVFPPTATLSPIIPS